MEKRKRSRFGSAAKAAALGAMTMMPDHGVMHTMDTSTVSAQQETTVEEQENNMPLKLVDAAGYGVWNAEVQDVEPAEVRIMIETVSNFPLQTFAENLAQFSGIPLEEVSAELEAIIEMNIYSPDSLAPWIAAADTPADIKQFLHELHDRDGRTFDSQAGTAIYLNAAGIADKADGDAERIRAYTNELLAHELTHAVHHRNGNPAPRHKGIAEALTYTIGNRMVHASNMPWERSDFTENHAWYSEMVYGEILLYCGQLHRVPVAEKFLRDEYQNLHKEVIGEKGNRKIARLDGRVHGKPPHIDKSELLYATTLQLFGLEDEQRIEIIDRVNTNPFFNISYIQDGTALGTIARDKEGHIRNGWIARFDGENMNIYMMYDGSDAPQESYTTEQKNFYYIEPQDEWAQMSDQDVIAELLK